MTFAHTFHSHRRSHYFLLRYLLPLVLALLLLFLFASPVRGQVWVDAIQLHGMIGSD